MKYKTIVIDPPWPIGSLGFKNEAKRRETNPDYELMTLDDIRNFNIEEFADNNCLFFIWVTSGKAAGYPTMKAAFEMLERWKATFYTIITWYKRHGVAPWGPLQFQTEHCVMGYRGRFNELWEQAANNKYSTFLDAPYAGHSVKPARFYQQLREWTKAPRIDIFARNAHEGFDGWGQEYVGNGTLLPYIEERGPLE